VPPSPPPGPTVEEPLLPPSPPLDVAEDDDDDEPDAALLPVEPPSAHGAVPQKSLLQPVADDAASTRASAVHRAIDNETLQARMSELPLKTAAREPRTGPQPHRASRPTINAAALNAAALARRGPDEVDDAARECRAAHDERNRASRAKPIGVAQA